MKPISDEQRKQNLDNMRRLVDIDLIKQFFALYNYSFDSFREEVQLSRTYLSSLFNGAVECPQATGVNINKAFNKVAKRLITSKSNPGSAVANRVLAYIKTFGSDEAIKNNMLVMQEEMLIKNRREQEEEIKQAKEEIRAKKEKLKQELNKVVDDNFGKIFTKE